MNRPRHSVQNDLISVASKAFVKKMKIMFYYHVFIFFLCLSLQGEVVVEVAVAVAALLPPLVQVPQLVQVVQTGLHQGFHTNIQSEMYLTSFVTCTLEKSDYLFLYP